jgi:hypothetical protein
MACGQRSPILEEVPHERRGGTERRRRLIERLNEKEKLIGSWSQAWRGQMTEEELAAEIEKQRTLDAARGSGGSF